MDKVLEEFIPLTITGIPSRSRNNDASLSQISNISRLSRSYAKIKKKSVTECRSTSIDSNCATEHMGTTVNTNHHKDSHRRAITNGLQFCPLCQAPFDIIKIDPKMHVDQCNVKFSELKECPVGELCFNNKLYHYRDYAHKVLAEIRASNGHLPQETIQYFTTTEKEIINNESQHFLSSVSEVKRAYTDDVTGHVSAHKKKPVHNEKTHTPRQDKALSVMFQNVAKRTVKPVVHTGDINDSCAGNRHVNCVDSDTNLKKFSSDNIRLTKVDCTLNRKQVRHPNGKVSKDHKLSDENLKSAGFEESNSNILTACEKSEGEVEDQEHAGVISNECNNELKLCAIVKYSTDKLKNWCGEKRNIQSCVLPCKVESDSKCTNEVKATISLVLSPSKESSQNREDKIRTPVKLDASCSEVGWETVEIAALPDTEVSDVTVSVCKCTKTLKINCSLSEKHTLTNLLDRTNMKTGELELKFFSNIADLGLSHKSSEKVATEVLRHQFSVTSYFRSSRNSSSRTRRILNKSASKPFAVSQDSHYTTPCDMKKTLNEHGESSSKASKQNQEAVVAYWKQRLDGMRKRGLSTMSVMSDDSLAVASDSQTSASTSNSSRRLVGKRACPGYKRIPDTSFAVDAFRYGGIPGISHYFLSHFHADHYGGLSRSFSKPIYCSKITAALVKMKLLVDDQYLHVLDMDVPKKINGVLVTALDANHCPGSVMFLFQLQNGQNHLHVGDFRADPKMESYPSFWNLTIDKLFLDTTYCEPRYTFPLQSETVQRVVELAVEHNRRVPSTLFVCGTYTLGKEKVFLGIVKALNCKLWACYEKRQVLECLDSQTINERLTNRQHDAQVHVCRMSDLNMSFLQSYLQRHEGRFTHIVAFIPTGWEMGRNSKALDNVSTTSCGNITIYGVPYSEHSSFTELRRFVQFLKPLEVVPTVNAADPTKRNSMTKYFKQWLSEASMSPFKRKSEGGQYVQQKIARYMKPEMEKHNS